MLPTTHDTDPAPTPAPARRWYLLSNHGLVLLSVARAPGMRIREIAGALELTDRACQRILNDLVAAGYIRRERVGRRNRYTIDGTRSMPAPLLDAHPVADLLGVFVSRTGQPLTP